MEIKDVEKPAKVPKAYLNGRGNLRKGGRRGAFGLWVEQPFLAWRSWEHPPLKLSEPQEAST